jgi:hypothetical protein
MDTLRDMEMLNQEWASERAPWKVWSEASGELRLLDAA